MWSRPSANNPTLMMTPTHYSASLQVRSRSVIATHRLQSLTGHSGGARWAALFSDGTTAVSGGDEGIKLWNVRSEQCDVTFARHARAVACVASSAEGQTLASGSDCNSIKLWSTRSCSLVRSIANAHSDRARGVAVFPEGGDRVASGSWGKTVWVWNVRSGECQHTLTGQTSGVYSVEISRDGRMLLSGSEDKSAQVWTLR